MLARYQAGKAAGNPGAQTGHVPADGTGAGDGETENTNVLTSLIYSCTCHAVQNTCANVL